MQADYARYKYVLDLDGDGCSGARPHTPAPLRASLDLAQRSRAAISRDLDLHRAGRLGKLFTSGAVVLKPWAAGYPFYYGALKAWEHYVPLKDDLSDLLERVRWLRRRWLHTRPSPDGAWTRAALALPGPCLGLA